jgi:hypothetical protein
MNRWMVAGAVVAAAVLSGCDSQIGLSDPIEALRHTGVRKLARGLGAANENRNASDDEMERKRAAGEQLALSASVDVDHQLVQVLESNPHFENLRVTSMAPAEIPMEAYPLLVSFDVEGGYHVELEFLVEQRRMLHFISFTSLPMLISGSIKREAKPLPLDELKLFLTAFSRDKESLGRQADAAWQAMRVREEAARQRAQANLEVKAVAAEHLAVCEETADARVREFAERSQYYKNADLTPMRNLEINRCMVRLKGSAS